MGLSEIINVLITATSEIVGWTDGCSAGERIEWPGREEKPRDYHGVLAECQLDP